MQTPKPALARFRRTVLRLVGLTGFLTLVLSGASCSKSSPRPPIVFGRLAVTTSTNANLVCATLTNLSGSVVVYLVCPPQVRSNGVWSGPPNPPRQKMTKLLAGQSAVVVVDSASTNENTRVPVLWGYYDYTPGATRWRQLTEDFVSRVRGHGDIGLLYTNYLTNLRP